jgi:glycosyltransferase involved in cell wall biosynthesis
MKIILIHNYYRQRGGEDTYVDSLKKLLEMNGNDVVFFSKKSADITSPVSKLTAAYNLLRGNIQVAHELSSVIRKEKPDIAHIANIYPLITDSIFPVLQINKIPIVETINTFRLMRSKGFINSPLTSIAISLSLSGKRVGQHVDAVSRFIFSSEIVAGNFRKHLAIPSNRISIIPYFVFPPAGNGAAEGKDFFLFVGRLSPEKRIVELIRVFSQLPHLKLVVVGDGPLRSHLQSIITRNVTISGRVSDAERSSLYRQATATIIPSIPEYEFGPLVLLESFSHGTPVVVPQAGVFVERVTEGKNGVLFGHMDDIAAKIAAVKFDRMRKYASSTYQKLYTPQRYYAQLMTLYETHCKKHL